MTNIDESVLRKIKKCLAMANDGRGNEQEAANALRMAQALMAKHNIDTKTLVRADFGDARSKTGSWAKPATWEVSLAHICARAFGAKFLITTYGGRGIQSARIRKVAEILFIGLKHQVELASYAFDCVRRQAIKARAEYIRTAVGTRGEKMAKGESFCRAFVDNVGAKVASLSLDPEQAQILDEIVVERSGGKPLKLTKRAWDHDALRAGAQAGANVSLHRGVDGGANETLKIGN